MEDNSSLKGFAGLQQLEKYARDLAILHESEKKKRKELQATADQVVKYAEDLNKTILELRSVHRDLKEAYFDTIYRLVLAAEYKDEDTGEHIVRMSRYCALIAKKLGLPADDAENILYAAPMHDVGKMGIPDSILRKPGKLTDEEFEIMRAHTTIGAKILTGSKAAILQLAEQIAMSHHEKWNGTGYPQGLSGDEIPLVGRIVSLADSFDALTSRRPYKNPYPVEVALEIITNERGRQYAPDVVDVFLENIDQILKIREQVGSDHDDGSSGFAWSERDLADGTVKSSKS